MPRLPAKFARMVEETERTDEATFFHLKGWVRFDGAHLITYEPGYVPWKEVLDDFRRLKPCGCRRVALPAAAVS